MERSESDAPKKILVMDDDEMIRFIAEQTLSRVGYDVTCVADGREALKAYMAARDEAPYVAVFLDLNIPGGMGGMETMKNLLELDPAAKGFIMSGDPTDPVMEDYADHGFYGAVEKRLLYMKSEMDAVLKELV